MRMLLNLCCGAFWSAAYIAAIIQGMRNKTWCIPQYSICMNFSWEFWVVMRRILDGSELNLGFAVQIIWLLLDIGIWCTWMFRSKQGRIEYIKRGALFLAVMIAMYFGVFCTREWLFSVFLINVLMSAEFLYRVDKDRSLWQSKFIAATKLLGTLMATIMNGIIVKNVLILWLGGLSFFLDGYYLLRFIRKREE